MNTKQLQKNVKKLEKFENTISIIEKISDGNVAHVNQAIKELAENEIMPDSEIGEEVTGIAKFFRNFGQKILNLLVIEVTCSFAGVTLFHFRVPKIKDNQVVENKSNKF